MIVVDDFITNAPGTREFALTLPFNVLGNYPGKRTMGHASATWVPFLEKLVGKPITWFDTHPFSYNGAFQVCEARDGTSWIHSDPTDYAAILFLTPDAPAAAGLTTYRHVPTAAVAASGPGQCPDASNPADWEPDCVVGNRFNRLVVFEGKRFHKASAYFGDAPGTARLFQCFFFNAGSPPLPRWNLDRPRAWVGVMSTNRYDYLETTLRSFRERVSFDGCELAGLVVFDDYPAARDAARMRDLADRYGVTAVVEHETNRGLPATWRHVWDAFLKTDATWLVHLEDDVEFVQDVRVADLVRAYAASPVPLTQLALKRQVVYPAGDVVADVESGAHGEEHPGGFVTQTRYFWTMASVCPRETVTRCAVDVLQEHTVAAFFGKVGMVGAMLGSRAAPPQVRHVGEVSRGDKGPGFSKRPGDYHFLTGEAVAAAAGETLPPVVVCVPTVPARKAQLDACLASLRAHAGHPHTVHLCVNDGDGYVAALHAMLRALAPETLVWALADDVVLTEPDTLRRLVVAYVRAFPDGDGVVCPDDGIQHGAIITMPLTTVKMLVQDYSTDFFHYYADTLFTRVMADRGKYVYCPEIHVSHRHWSAGLADKDVVYAATEKWYAHDEAVYRTKMAARQ